MATELFKVMAGVSSDTFTIGDVTFMAAPFTMMEYGAFLALPEDAIDLRVEFLADKLRRRVRGNKIDPATITEQWLMENLELPKLPILQHVLLHGKMPEAADTEKKPLPLTASSGRSGS